MTAETDLIDRCARILIAAINPGVENPVATLDELDLARQAVRRVVNEGLRFPTAGMMAAGATLDGFDPTGTTPAAPEAHWTAAINALLGV